MTELPIDAMAAESGAAKHSLVMALAETETLRPGRRAARLLEHLEAQGWELVRRRQPQARPEPDPWGDYRSINAKLLGEGIAVSRTMTSAAMCELGLNPDEIRAVVIEPTTVHVFRHSDRTTHQHMPILNRETR